MRLSDAHHFRKMVAGACMVVAPVVLLASMVIHPASDMNEATQVATIADNLDAWYVAHLLALISIALTVPVILGLMHVAGARGRVRARGRRPGDAGTARSRESWGWSW